MTFQAEWYILYFMGSYYGNKNVVLTAISKIDEKDNFLIEINQT